MGMMPLPKTHWLRDSSHGHIWGMSCESTDARLYGVRGSRTHSRHSCHQAQQRAAHPSALACSHGHPLLCHCLQDSCPLSRLLKQCKYPALIAENT
jgi:hypothetical protein